jgi:hypothetical protein
MNSKEVESSNIVFLLLNLKEPFVALRLALSTLQRLLNSIKEWGRYGGVWCQEVQCFMMGE